MSEEKLPGWMRRLAHLVGGWLRKFRAKVDDVPWLAPVYKVVVAIIGTVVIFAGIAMLVLPGPGWLTIFLGLAIMGSEFAWARKLLQRLKTIVLRYADRIKRWWRAHRDGRGKKD